MIEIEVSGLPEVLEHLEKFAPKKRLSATIKALVGTLLGYVTGRTPVVTGSMKAAWRGKMHSPLVGEVFINPQAVNSETGVRVISYAPTIDQKYGIVDGALSRTKIRFSEFDDF